MRVLIDGVPTPEANASISVFDWALLRGFGIFEVVRVYDGTPFRLGAHLDRFDRSARALELEIPARSDLESWVVSQAAEGGDCLVRIYATAGARDPLFAAPSRVVTLWEPVPEVPDELRVLPLLAPWHAAGFFSELTFAKTLSYAANMAAGAAAQRAGYHDALLYSRERWVLEGPTFSIGWWRDGALQLPALELGVLHSITRAAAVEAATRLGIQIAQVRCTLEDMVQAEEVVALSTIKEVLPITAVGDRRFGSGPLTRKLAATFRELVVEETA